MAEAAAALLERAERWAAALAARDLAAPATLAALEQILGQSRDERLDLPDDPLLVAMLCGPTVVGKSSLINALAGADISRPGLGAATANAVLYIHEADDPARLFEYSQALGRLGGEPAAVVRHRRDALLHKVLVDTPDIDSAVRQHREITAALVHCADLVLFVTSPEKYKTMQAAHWVAQQRPQRAIAFVLNKWDRGALGLQFERRALLEADFRALLTREGFADPVVFKVSALGGESGNMLAGENQIGELSEWIAAGLDHSAAAAIQERRRRAGWGRLAAAITAARPETGGIADFSERVVADLVAARSRAHGDAEATAQILAAPGLDGDTWPATPGLLGAWTRTSRRIVGAAGRVRALVAGRDAPIGFVQGEADAVPMPSARLMQAIHDLAETAATARIRLGPAVVECDAAVAALSRQLAILPAEMAATVGAAARRWSLRRVCGIAVLYGVEIVLAAILALAGWRLGTGFVSGAYESSGLLLNTAALLVIVTLLGQLAGNIFFPPLQTRWRRMVAQQAQRLIAARSADAERIIAEQLDAATRLAGEGGALLAEIDRVVTTSLALPAPSPMVDRLFGARVPAASPRQPVLD